ncbi:MAG TPA: helix-turn-helix transcriptional regulator [Actinophytocola sp.]|uniref:helix-turn-helix domain-containing protein n=1 Tax=Actinophytocola sp. TaxID=1872138 RepID=UPI002DDD450F|nr:helix-turn-helix transcriptional regulator [Actinophytocola sp.]HEV2778342.1 helix-turn-helix transcriptional regulator [Actinophytocola sp.]
MSDNELGAYLRDRREAVTPADLGLPVGARRRTPGLRRSELATLAGISVEYLTRLEQGRDRHPSAQVLGALADALRLSADERMHLRLLAKAGTGHICPASAPARSVRPTVLAMLERLEPTPAIVLNRLADVLAHTTGYALLAGPVGVLDGERPNLARFLFTDARARTAFPDWERVATDEAANLRIESYRDDPAVAELTELLTVIAGAAFTERLAAATGLPRRSGVERWQHPEAGPLRLAYETLDLADEQRMIVYLPADDATSTALATLTGRRPGALRAVP